MSAFLDIVCYNVVEKTRKPGKGGKKSKKNLLN